MNTKNVDIGKSGEDVNNFRSCRDLSDIIPLYSAKGLYLKPIAKINISVNLPQLKTPGKTLSTWEIMEKIRLLIRPDEFASLKVTKSTLEFLRLEADLTDKCRLAQILARLEGQRLNLTGFVNVLKVRAVEAKDDFPTKHTWDSFFRDAKNMNELKPGERPDTVYISGLPIKWFSENDEKIPSEFIIMNIFKKWGNIRRIDIPVTDPYRSRMKLSNGIKKYNFGNGVFFDVYIQYYEYVDFVKLMDSLRGMKILKKDGDKYFTTLIKVDFDKTKHMNDNSVSYRDFEQKRLIEHDNLISEKLRKKEEAEVKLKEKQKKKEEADKEAKYVRRKKREERRKRKALTIFRKQEEDKVSMKIAREEQKLIKAQRQLESIRLLDELFDRIKIKVEKGEIILGDKTLSNKDFEEQIFDKITNNNDKIIDKKDKKLKKKKSKKEKRKKKKGIKNSDHSSDDSSTEENSKKLISTPGSSITDSSFTGTSRIGPNLGFPLYSQFPQSWFYDAAAMMFPPMARGRSSMNRYMRGRGRIAFSGRRGRRLRSMNLFNPHIYNEQYYKYFARLAGVDTYDSEYSNSRSRSRDRSKSRPRSRSRSRSRSKTTIKKKNKKHKNMSRSHSLSPCRSRLRRHRKTTSKSRTRSRSRSIHTKSRNFRSQSQSKSRSRSRSNSTLKKNRRKRNRSKVRITRAKSRSITPKKRSRSKSWSMPRSPRQRSCSWSKIVDEVNQNTKDTVATNNTSKK